MKAILVGTIAGGFGIHLIAPEDEAAVVVSSLLSMGRLAEAIEIQAPDRLAAFEGGTRFVAYDGGFGNGLELFGPFENDEVAEDYAEDHRDEGKEWEIFIYDKSMLVDITPAQTTNDGKQIITRLLDVLHPGAVGLIYNHHGQDRGNEASTAIMSAKVFLGQIQ